MGQTYSWAQMLSLALSTGGAGFAVGWLAHSVWDWCLLPPGSNQESHSGHPAQSETERSGKTSGTSRSGNKVDKD